MLYNKVRESQKVSECQRGEKVHTITDLITRYIERRLEEAEGQVELNRGELAEKFSCVPSQVTYVLKTRFTPSHGYHVISIRGGGGYIRIIAKDIDEQLYDLIGKQTTEKQALYLLQSLYERDFLSEGEYVLLRPLLSDSILGMSGEDANRVRSRILKSIVSSLTE